MERVLFKAGAMVLSLSALGLLVGHAGLTGCRAEPAPVVIPSAENAAIPPSSPEATQAAGDPKPASSEVGANGAVEATPGAAALNNSKSGKAPSFMGASKAAPVFREDEVGAMRAQKASSPAAPKPPPQQAPQTSPKVAQ